MSLDKSFLNWKNSKITTFSKDKFLP